MPGTSPSSIMKSTSDIELLGLDEDRPPLTGEMVSWGGKRSSRGALGKRLWVRDIADSFRPINTESMRNSVDASTAWPGTRFYNLKSASLDAASPHLATKLKGRHLQMIAFGGSIGAGLFVASGRALSIGGPGSLLMAVAVVGIMLLCTCEAMSELAVAFPVAGSFSSWATRFVDPSWGFALGWNYALQWLIILPLELIAASLTLGYWSPQLSKVMFVGLFLILIIGINLFGVKGYGEAEFIFSSIKIVAVISFILLGIVINCVGPPEGGYIGGKYWRDPGALNNGFRGFSGVLVMVTFAFGGTELVGLAAAETANPRKSLPAAAKQVFWRISLFYFLTLALIGLTVPHNEPRLSTGSSSVDARASPFVIAIELAGIDGLPSVMNAVILIAVLAVGNSAVYASTRSLAALANLRHAPKFLGIVDRKGRPMIAIAIALVFGLLAFIADLPQQGEIMEWLMAISGISTLVTWGSICLCHIRFRQAWLAQGHTLAQLPTRSRVGIGGSYVGLTLNITIMAAQMFTTISPIDAAGKTQSTITRDAVVRWLGAPILLLSFGLHKLYFGTSFLRVHQMDVDTGRRRFNYFDDVVEREAKASWPRWKRIYKILC